jgi:hypothetical protein
MLDGKRKKEKRRMKEKPNHQVWRLNFSPHQ